MPIQDYDVDNKTPSPTAGAQEAGILDANEARGLLAEGWQAADLHVHTLHSHDVIPTCHVDPLVLYDKARRLGMTYVAFTDHDSMDAYDRVGWTREGLVPAVEVKILDLKKVGHTVHINIYALNRRQFREIMKIARMAQDLERLIAYLKDEHLRFTFNHPFWHEPGEEPNLRAVIAIAELFPVLEYNMGRIARINKQALRLVQANPATPRFAQKILEIILEAASRSGIPGSLYFRSQRNLAAQISSVLESVEIAA